MRNKGRRQLRQQHQRDRTSTSTVQQMPPVNKTLLSTGKDKIIIIEPEGGDGREQINNPIKTNIILEQSVFRKLNIKNIRAN